MMCETSASHSPWYISGSVPVLFSKKLQRTGITDLYQYSYLIEINNNETLQTEMNNFYQLISDIAMQLASYLIVFIVGIISFSLLMHMPMQ